MAPSSKRIWMFLLSCNLPSIVLKELTGSILSYWKIGLIEVSIASLGFGRSIGDCSFPSAHSHSQSDP